MARKTLNRKNLIELGADRLAELPLQAVEGDAARQRRVRMALAEGQSAQDTAPDIRKRFASIRRARGFLSSRGQQTLVRELADLDQAEIAMLADRRSRNPKRSETRPGAGLVNPDRSPAACALQVIGE